MGSVSLLYFSTDLYTPSLTPFDSEVIPSDGVEVTVLEVCIDTASLMLLDSATVNSITDVPLLNNKLGLVMLCLLSLHGLVTTEGMVHGV